MDTFLTSEGRHIGGDLGYAVVYVYMSCLNFFQLLLSLLRVSTVPAAKKNKNRRN